VRESEQEEGGQSGLCKGGTRNSVCPSAKAQWLSRHKGPSSLWPDLVGRRRSVRQRPAPKRKATAKAKSKTLENQGKKRDCAFADDSHDEQKATAKAKSKTLQKQGKKNGTVPLQTALMTSNRKVLKSSFCAGSGGSRWVSILVPSNVVQNNGDEADTFTVHTHTHRRNRFGEVDSALLASVYSRPERCRIAWAVERKEIPIHKFPLELAISSRCGGPCRCAFVESCFRRRNLGFESWEV